MRILVENFKIECFEDEREFRNWAEEHKNDSLIANSTVYVGEYYGIPQNIKDLFTENLLVSIKRQCYNDVQFIIIHK